MSKQNKKYNGINVNRLTVYMIEYSLHATNLQQKTLKTSMQKYGKSLLMKVELLNEIKNIVEKGEIAYYDLSKSFSKMGS